MNGSSEFFSFLVGFGLALLFTGIVVALTREAGEIQCQKQALVETCVRQWVPH